MRKPKRTNLEALRRRLKAGLPGRIETAVAAYDAFGEAPPPDDPKGFAAHQAACKAALAHVEMLTKLLRWAEGEAATTPNPDDEGVPDIGRMMAEARIALSELAGDDDDVDDEEGA